ncbi:hypothetical protein PHSC3_000785 [Chlamydiales bacterium STE3]|nr:hypothetical protein PHSC3_000785 [Chlamydiales bacterium STE3]
MRFLYILLGVLFFGYSFAVNTMEPFDFNLVIVDEKARKCFTTYSKEIANRNGWILLHPAGVHSIVNDRLVVWASKYMVKPRPMTKEQFEPIVLEAYKYLFTKVKNEPFFDEYLQCWANDYHTSKRELTSDLVGIRIDFWDGNVDRYTYPNLAQVIVKGGKVYYYYADPKTQVLQQPVVEDLPDWVLKSEGL